MQVEQKSVKNAAFSVFIGGVISKVFNFVSSIILARILVPEDYGYWVIVTMITSFFSLVIDAGFEYYYIVKVNINEGEETPQDEVVKIENSIFFLRVIVNMVLFILQFSLSFLPIELLSSPVDKIIRLLSFVHIINVAGRINEVRLKKHFNFNKITKFNIVSTIISMIVQVSCALIGLGVMSFAWGGIVKTLVNNIGLVSIGRFTPKRKYVSRSVLKEVFAFAIHSWIGNIGLYLNNQIDKFLLRKNFSMTDVGYYSFGNGTAYMFMTYIVYPQASVIMNFVSNNQGHTKKLEEFVAFINKFLFIIVLPVQVFLFVFAEQFIDFLYGAKWLVAIPLFRLFILKSFIEIFFYPYSVFLTAHGRVDYLAKLNWLAVVLFSLSLYITTLFSTNIIFYAIVFVICSFVISLIKSYLSVRVSKIRIRNVYSKIKLTMLISVLMVALMFLPFSMNIISKVIVFGLTSVVFISLILLYDRKTIIEMDQRFLGAKMKNYYHKFRK